MSLEYKGDAARPSRVYTFWYLEVIAEPPATSATRTAEALQQLAINDEARPPTQQASLTPLVNVQTLADDLGFVCANRAQHLEHYTRKNRPKVIYTTYDSSQQPSNETV